MKKFTVSIAFSLLAFCGVSRLLAAEYVIAVSDSNDVTVIDDGGMMPFSWQKEQGTDYYSFVYDEVTTGLGLIVSDRTGYRFKGWYTPKTGDGQPGPADCSELVTENQHITWAEITSHAPHCNYWFDDYLVCPKFVKVWTVSASAEPEEGGTVSGAATVDEGSTLTLTATPAEGYQFAKWSDGVTTNPRRVTNVQGDQTYTAVFSPKSYTLKVDPNGGTFLGSAEPYVFPVDRLTWGQKTLGSIGVATKSDGSELQGFRDANGQPVYDAQGKNVKCDYWTDSYANGGVFRGTSNLTVRAIWGEPPKRYTITATAEPNAAGTVLGADTYVEGKTVKLTAQPSPGYSFKAWTQDGQEVSKANPWSFSASADAAYGAVFTGNVYTVSFMGEGIGSLPTKEVTFGETYGELPAYDSPTMDFKGWYFTEDCLPEGKVEADTKVTKVGDHWLYAKLDEKKEFKVTFVDPTEDLSRRNSQIPVTYAKGKTVSEPPDDTSRWSEKWKGEYWIAGWDPPLPQTVTNDLTITALRESIATVLDCADQGLVFRRDGNWQVCTNDHKEGSSCLKLESSTAQDAVETTLNAEQGGLLTFWWKGEAAGKLRVKVLQGGEDYSPKPFVATNGEWKIETVPIEEGESAVVTFTYEPQEFNALKIDAVTWNPGAKPSRTVIVTCGEHGKLKQGSTGTFPSGSDIILEAEPDPGYAFCCWTNDTGFATNENPWTFTVVEAVSYTATFTNAQYVVTLDPNGGTGGDASVLVTYLNPLPDLASTPTRTGGWTFNGYTNAAGVAYYDADGEGLKAWDQPNAAKLFAQWKAPDEYALTVKVEGQGSVIKKPDAPQYVANTTVDLEAKPDIGAAFAQWDDGEKSSTRTVTMTGDITLTATFTNCQYVVTFDPNGGSVTQKTKIVTYGDTYGDLPTPMRNGYTFKGWFTQASGGNKVEATTTVTTDADKQKLFAQWDQEVGELSKALDCSNLDFTATGGWAVFTNETFAKEGISCLSNSVPGAELSTKVTAAGTLTFWWRGRRADDFVRVKVSTNSVEIKSLEMKVLADDLSEWAMLSLDITASSENQVDVLFKADEDRYDGDMALDFVTWTPETPAHPEPTDADKVTISTAGVADGKFTLSFTSDERFDYNLLTNANLLIDSWGKMEKKVGTGETLTFEPEIVDGHPQLFYKVETIQRQD